MPDLRFGSIVPVIFPPKTPTDTKKQAMRDLAQITTLAGMQVQPVAIPHKLLKAGLSTDAFEKLGIPENEGLFMLAMDDQEGLHATEIILAQGNNTSDIVENITRLFKNIIAPYLEIIPTENILPWETVVALLKGEDNPPPPSRGEEKPVTVN